MAAGPALQSFRIRLRHDACRIGRSRPNREILQAPFALSPLSHQF